MPAKIPRPIGSTEIFFPGIWKAAAVLEEALELVLSAAADMLLLAEGLVDGGDVVGGLLVAAGLGTEDNPTTDTPGSTGLVDAGGGEDKDVEATVLDCAPEDWTPGTIVHCRTTCTSGSPFFPVTGVNVTVHVWVAGPEGVLIVCTV